MSPETHDHELNAWAQNLSGLAPSAGRLDRDQLLFRAGQVSVGKRSRPWQAIAAVMTLLAGAVGLAHLLPPEPQGVQCIIYQRVEPPTSAADLIAVQPSTPHHGVPSPADETVRQAERMSYSRLQRVVFMEGVDALPKPPAAFGARQRDPLLNRPTDVWGWNHWLRTQTP